MPMLVIAPSKVINALREQAHFYDSIQGPGYWQQAISGSELGIPLIIASAIGFACMLRNRAARPAAINWLTFAVITSGIFLPRTFQPFRNFLPFVPLLCIAAAVFVVQFAGFVATASSRPHLRLYAAIAAAAVISAPPAFASVRQITQRMSHVDSRIQAVDWLQEHAPAESSILVIEELTIQRAKLGRIPARIEVVPWRAAADRVTSGHFDYVVTGEFDIQHSSDAEALSGYQARWLQQLASRRTEAAFGYTPNPLVRYFWRTNDQRITVMSVVRR